MAMSGGWGRLGLRPLRQHELFVVKELDARKENVREAKKNGLLDDDEFLVLWQAHKPKNPEFPYEEHGRFSFNEP